MSKAPDDTIDWDKIIEEYKCTPESFRDQIMSMAVYIAQCYMPADKNQIIFRLDEYAVHIVRMDRVAKAALEQMTTPQNIH